VSVLIVWVTNFLTVSIPWSDRNMLILWIKIVTSASYSGGSCLTTRSSDRPSWVRFFVVTFFCFTQIRKIVLQIMPRPRLSVTSYRFAYSTVFRDTGIGGLAERCESLTAIIDGAQAAGRVIWNGECYCTNSEESNCWLYCCCYLEEFNRRTLTDSRVESCTAWIKQRFRAECLG